MIRSYFKRSGASSVTLLTAGAGKVEIIPIFLDGVATAA
jgi:hypothetical protein